MQHDLKDLAVARIFGNSCQIFVVQSLAAELSILVQWQEQCMAGKLNEAHVNLISALPNAIFIWEVEFSSSRAMHLAFSRTESFKASPHDAELSYACGFNATWW